MVQRTGSTQCDKQQQSDFHAVQKQEKMDQEHKKIQRHIAQAVQQMSIGIVIFYIT